MKINRLLCIVPLAAAVLTVPRVGVAADDKPAFKDDKEKASYAIGMMFGSQIKRGGFEVDVDTITSGIKDTLGGKETRLAEKDAREAIMAYQQTYMKQAAEKNKKEGASFLAENKSKPGVKTKTVTLPDGKAADLQYKVVTEGAGPSPGTNDIVTVNYRGTLLNGKEFDSSAKRGQPAKFGVTRVVKGWTEALLMMKPGAKWEVWLPSDLAYGDMGNSGIEPGATLVFEIELVATESAPPPAAPSQPLTSDIIRVPSADEMKKGAKIEVIKQEELEKRAKEEKQKEAQKK